MPLNLSVSEGDFTPYIKYNAKAGRFYVKPEGATEEVEITNPVLAFDMANVRTGWLYYAEGAGPEKVWDPSPTQMAAKPPGPRKFKRGFEVMVFGNMMIPGTNKALGMRELSSTANNVISAFMNMYNEYEVGMKNHPGSVPVFECRGVKPIPGAYGTNYEPQFVLKTWVPRSKVPAFDEHATKEEPAHSNGSQQYSETNPPPVESEDAFGLPPVRAGSMKDQLQDTPF
jgi:hypothetical protein